MKRSLLVGTVIVVLVVAVAYAVYSVSTTAACFQGQSGPPGALLIHVVSDNPSGSSVRGAAISGYVSVNCEVGPPTRNIVARTPIGTLVTPINGTVTNPEPKVDGNYSLTVTYLRSHYTLNAVVYPELITLVNLYIPSGRVNVTTTGCYPDFMTMCGYVVFSPSSSEGG